MPLFDRTANFDRPRFQPPTDPASIETARRTAAALAAGAAQTQVRSVPQGLNLVAQDIFSGLLERKANQGEEQLRQQTADSLFGLLDPTTLGFTDPEALRQAIALNPQLGEALLGMQLERQMAGPAGPTGYEPYTNEGGFTGQRNLATGQIDWDPEFMQPQPDEAAQPGFEWLTGDDIAELNAQGVALDPGRPYQVNLETGEVRTIGGQTTGLALDIDPETGAVSLRQGEGAGALPTGLGVSQSLNATYSGRMAQADTIVNQFATAGSDWWQRFLAAITPDLFGRMLNTPEYQQYEQAERNFINAVLRRESGAVIAEEEFANARQQYMPQPGDGPEVLEQKRQNREFATLLMGAGVTPGFNPYEAYQVYLSQGNQPLPGAATTGAAPAEGDRTQVPLGTTFTDVNGVTWEFKDWNGDGVPVWGHE